MSGVSGVCGCLSVCFLLLGSFSLVLKNKIPPGNGPAPSACALCCQLRLRLGWRFNLESLEKLCSHPSKKKRQQIQGRHCRSHLAQWDAACDNRGTFAQPPSRTILLLSAHKWSSTMGRDQKNKTSTKSTTVGVPLPSAAAPRKNSSTCRLVCTGRGSEARARHNLV